MTQNTLQTESAQDVQAPEQAGFPSRSTRSPLARLLTAALLLIGFTASAQQEFNYNQYFHNGSIRNPAQTGLERQPKLSLLGRHQWSGFKGAPKSYFLLAETSVKDRMGLGLGIGQDEIGPIKSTMLAFNYSYEIRFNKDYILHAGLRSSMTNYQVGLSRLLLTDDQNAPSDQSFAQDIYSSFAFNGGTGLYLTAKRLNLGISVPFLLERHSVDTYKPSIERHYYVYGSYQIPVSEHITLTPNVMVKVVKDAPVQIDMSLWASMGKLLEAGLLLRRTEAASGLLRLHLNSHLDLGYSYEYPINGLRAVTASAQEINLLYRFKRRKAEKTTPSEQ